MGWSSQTEWHIWFCCFHAFVTIEHWDQVFKSKWLLLFLDNSFCDGHMPSGTFSSDFLHIFSLDPIWITLVFASAQGMPDGLALGFTLVPPNELAGEGWRLTI